jgi:hypothetical protein
LSRLAWAELTPGHRVAQASRRGRYEARRVDECDRWTLAGPRDRSPWFAGTLADVERCADEMNQHHNDNTPRR